MKKYNPDRRYATVPWFLQRYFTKYHNYAAYLHDRAYIRKQGFWLYHDLRLFFRMLEVAILEKGVLSKIRHAFMAIATLLFLLAISWLWWFDIGVKISNLLKLIKNKIMSRPYKSRPVKSADKKKPAPSRKKKT